VLAKKDNHWPATATTRLRGLHLGSPPLGGTDRPAENSTGKKAFCACRAVRRAWRRVRPLRGPATLVF